MQKQGNTMEDLSYEELVAMFGPEVANEMQKQKDDANGAGGSSIPFPLLKKVTDSDAGIGEFGSFVFGTKFAKDKDADGNSVVEDAGTNIGKEFDMVIINVSYRFKRWNETTSRTERSNIFTDMGGFKTAIDYSGNPISGDKEVRKKQEWKTVKIIGAIVKVGKEWKPVVFEVDGKMYFTLNELLDKTPNKGWLSGIAHIVTKGEKKGTTKYTVIDVEKSSFEPFPTNFLKDNKDVVSEVTLGMKKYQEGEQYSKNTKPDTTNTPDTYPDSSDNVDNW